MSRPKRVPAQPPAQGVMAPPNEAESRRVYRDYPVTTQIDSEYSVATVKAIIREHEQGNFFRSASLIEAMGRDDRIEGALRTLILGILRLPFNIVPAGEEKRGGKATAKAKKAAQFIADLWSKAVPEPQLQELCKWVLMGGVGIAQVLQDLGEDDWKPCGLKVQHLSQVYWREDLQRYVVMTADGMVIVEPGEGKWIVISPTGLRSFLSGAVRTLWRWWLLRDYVARDWGRHSEVLGQGIFRAYIPQKSDKDSKDRFFSTLQSMGSDGILQLGFAEEAKDGFNVDLLEAEFDHGAGFEKLLLRCEANIAVLLLGQNATSEAQGQYVARGVFSKVTLDRIDGLVGPLEAGLRDHLCRPVCQFNFDDADLAPLPDQDAEPPPDKLALANTLMNLGQFLQTAFLAGQKADATELSQRFGLTLTEITPPAILQIEASKQAAVQAAQPTAPPPTKSGQAQPESP